MGNSILVSAADNKIYANILFDTAGKQYADIDDVSGQKGISIIESRVAIPAAKGGFPFRADTLTYKASLIAWNNDSKIDAFSDATWDIRYMFISCDAYYS